MKGAAVDSMGREGGRIIPFNARGHRLTSWGVILLEKATGGRSAKEIG
jgi:hypothetical protein